MGGRGGGGTPGTVTLYHQTSRRAADAIVRDGFTPTYAEGTEPSYRETQGKFAFLTRKPGAAGGYGDTTVAVTVSRDAVQRDAWSGHVKVALEDLPGPSAFRVLKRRR